MIYDNNASRLHREILIRICEAHLENETADRLDRLPLELRPRGSENNRCCLYRDRALIKYRAMAALGSPVEEETDEMVPLSEYADRAHKRARTPGPTATTRVLSVIDEACDGCIRSHYYVTDACRGCLARPCTLVCPKHAVTIQDGHAHIDPDLCVNCGKCMKACPYHSIVYVPIPCEEACPAGAISRGDNGKQAIDETKCIHCGKCKSACPFGAVVEVSQIAEILTMLTGPNRTVALFAPALAHQFEAELGQIVAAIKALGFDEVVEVAWGADETARLEAEEFAEHMRRGEELLTNSCCPAWAAAVEKHLPKLHDHLSTTPTPMSITAREAKRRWPDAATVFVGPCIAKRDEAAHDENVDAVLSFEELGAALIAAGIDVETLSPMTPSLAGGNGGRGFPLAGGVTAAIAPQAPAEVEMKPRLIDGLDRKTMALLRVMPKARGDSNFIEVMACQGGCIGGPATLCSVKRAQRRSTANTAKPAGEP